MAQGQEPTDELKTTPEAESEEPKQDSKPKMFDEAYVKELRAENAKHRTELRAVQKQLEELLGAQKTREEQELATQNQWQQLAEKRATELEAANKQLKAMEVQFVRVKVAAEFGLNVPLDEDGGETLADRLHGNTEEELRKDAAKLAKLIKPAEQQAEEKPPTPSTDPKPAEQQTPQTARSQSTTTAIPGGPPVSNDDAEMRKAFFGGAGSSAVFSDSNANFVYHGGDKLPDNL